MKSVWIAAAFSAVTAVVVACSSSSNNGSGSGSNSALISCLNSEVSQGATTTVSSACESCVESKCSSQLSDLSNACSAIISCICPNGTYSAAAVTSQTCISLEEGDGGAGCGAASTTFDSCQQSNCASECNPTSSSSGSSSGTTGSGGTSSGSTSLTGDCLKYYNCCVAISGSTAASSCQSAAEGIQTADPAECTAAFQAEQASGGDGGAACQ